MKKINEIIEFIALDTSTFFYRGKKALMLIGMASILANYFESTHDGGLVALIWDALPVAGPSIMFIIAVNMVLRALKKMNDPE